jgi:hypothetical protein
LIEVLKFLLLRRLGERNDEHLKETKMLVRTDENSQNKLNQAKTISHKQKQAKKK